MKKKRTRDIPVDFMNPYMAAQEAADLINSWTQANDFARVVSLRRQNLPNFFETRRGYTVSFFFNEGTYWCFLLWVIPSC